MMKKALRDEGQSSARCSGCSRQYSWSVSEAQPINLFPLLCGDIFCRACLSKETQAVLSSRQVPLRCCARVVPHDFIRKVVPKEEDAYYSYLLDRTREIGRDPHVQQTASQLPGNEAAVELETKQPATYHLTAQVPNALDTPAIANTVVPTIPSQQTRYPSRHRHALLAQKASMQSGITATILRHGADQRRDALDAQASCHVCKIQVGIVQIKAPCAHMFCYHCLGTKVRSYIDMNSNEEEAPASCCGQLLPLDLVQLVIFRRELITYAKRMVKYQTTHPATGGKRKAATGSKAKTQAKRMKKVVDLTEEDERTCISCFSPVASPDKWRVVPCGHGYCVSCLKMMAKLSLTNRNQIPIRCCSKEFPTEYIKAVLNRTEFDKYSRYLAERDPSSSTLQSDLDYAAVIRKNRGKQCPTCGVGVVKNSGCNAMTCPLGHHFCWKCLHTKCTCGRVYAYH